MKLPALAALAAVSLVASPRAGLAKKPTPADAKAFMARVNAELRPLKVRVETAEWIKSIYITVDTERNAAALQEDLMAWLSRTIPQAKAFKGLALDPETARGLYLLSVSTTLPAPSEPAGRGELAATAARLEAMYGSGKYCKGGTCRDLGELSEVLAESRDWDTLLDAWAGWHQVAVPMKALYERLVALSNEGARELGFADLGELWRAGYDMTPAELEQESDRLWNQVKPLYLELHCYVRARLGEKYGTDKVPQEGPIPAHILGNMWAQDWTAIYPMVEPYPGKASLDVDGALEAQGWDAKRMAKLAESFFTSLGMDPLPDTFWERSMFTRPSDREVVCHASAWDTLYHDDLRIKMCIKPTEEDLVTLHHELGHLYYYHAYRDLPILFQQGANDGFHEAIGDALALSVTPEYLKRVGLVPEVPSDEQGLIDVQMKKALERIAFLPFGRLIDQWRWDVFAGRVKPEQWNAHWWDLRRKYQGVTAPAPRPADAFDPGAKYHIAGNVPYMRYFLALILQFQFHRALCQAAGHTGPLHTCSIYGNKEAGKRLQAMLALGASRPWADALEALTGQRQMDATAVLDYFAPLRAWLAEQNRGRRCGW